MHAWRETGKKKSEVSEHTFGVGPVVWRIAVRCTSCGSVGFRRAANGWQPKRSQVTYTWEQPRSSECQPLNL